VFGRAPDVGDLVLLPRTMASAARGGISFDR